MNGTAFSPCRQYRYRWWRYWDGVVGSPPMVFIMLNPSTADETKSDPTVTRCMNYAKRTNHGGVEVVNLYAWRATDPRDLKAAGYPIGDDNDAAIMDAVTKPKATVVCAWGAHARGQDRPQQVIDMIKQAGITTHALAFTADGIPRHPLMLRADCKLEPMQ